MIRSFRHAGLRELFETGRGAGVRSDLQRRALVRLKVLDEAGGGGPPEFLSTHPKPANRVEYIKKVIAEEFPDGVPEGLRP